MMAMNGHQDKDTHSTRWVARMLSGTMTVEETAAYDRWRDEDEANASSADSLWDMVDSLDAVGEQALEEEMVRDLEAATDAHKRRRRFMGISAIAAGFAAVAVIGATLWMQVPKPAQYETQKGQRTTVYLADGSVMQLNTDTKVSVMVNDSRREITLERGEAFFSVKHDEKHPFLVYAGDTKVQDLGTKFSVRMGASSNLISVLSGLVSVSQRQENNNNTRPQELALLRPGEQAVYTAATHSATVATFDPDRAFAWRKGKARYKQTPLADVVEDLNRYFKAPLEIADSDLRTLPVTGTFSVNDQGAVVDALESAFSLMAVRRSDGVILLYAQQNR
ncbi:FecR family protein [Kordiimonas marina]|uniref:FecR family protein n=1 Tax=Kordiimonas marina TaxID=2872312 RepID=UPI001FF1D830|nr:FecR domain-containing protein [Kordiimonas marina]MCJ9430549.1 FecR domain-containing protein [Kordiimonas marina]